MPNILREWSGEASLELLLLGCCLAVLTASFVVKFLVPGLRLSRLLSEFVAGLQPGQKLAPDDLEVLFKRDSSLAHRWAEFRATLHPQESFEGGQVRVSNWRASVSAGAFFNFESIAEPRLATEFFKHLPGIFTGVGIIGTFLGLIRGLSSFNVSVKDPEVATASLAALLGNVSEAFMVSLSAISLAILVTLCEKVMISRVSALVRDLAERLDALFATGADEEYLARLVVASEESAAQAKILKDALVGELKAILQDISERQMQASQATSMALGQHISEGINVSLRDPLERIGGLVQRASADQSASASRLLEDVMTSFSQRLNELFGSQIRGISGLNESAAATMTEAVASLTRLVVTMEESGKRSSEVVTEQVRLLAEQVTSQVATSQSTTSQRLHELLEQMGEQMTSVVEAMRQQANSSIEDQRHYGRELATRTEGLVSAMSGSVETVVVHLGRSVRAMQDSISALEQVVSSSVGKMKDGALLLERGAVSFAAAGDKVTGVMERAISMTGKLSELAGALTDSSDALQSILADHRAVRDSLASLLAETRSFVEAARRDASMTDDVLMKLQAASDRLAAVEVQADRYLQEVVNVLAESHERFAEGMAKTVNESNFNFQEKLGAAVKMLTATIQELELVVSEAAEARR